MSQSKFNSELDLMLERVVDVPRELIWAAWEKVDPAMKSSLTVALLVA